MTIYVKCLITTLSAMLLVNVPSNNEEPLEAKKTITHDVEKLIDLTKRDIRDLEIKIDSILMAKGDSLIVKQINNGTTNSQ